METLCHEFSTFAVVRSATHKKRYIGKALDIAFTLAKYLHRSDVVLIDVFSTKAFYFALFTAAAARLSGTKYILNLHGGSLPDRYLKSERMFTLLLKNAHAVTAPSGYLKQYFENKGYAVRLIPNPIDISIYPKSRAHRNYPVMLYLRSFGKLYRPENIIDAMVHITQKYPEAHLHMFGKDVEGRIPMCREKIRIHKLEKNITLHGVKLRNEWLNTAVHCNMSISVPVTDNTPVSLLESMSMNIPVITTGAGGIEYIIQDRKNGLITTGEPEDIAHKVIELMENENLYTTIQKSAADYVMMYNMPEVIRLWKELLTNNRS